MMKSGRPIPKSWLLLLLIGGCGDFPPPPPRILFAVPMTINGESIGEGVLDTGGDFEVLLKEAFGLEIVGMVSVLAFGGRELLDVTEPFVYSANGFQTISPGAIVGLSACSCSGVGFRFFRRTGVVLGLDYVSREAEFLIQRPPDGIRIPFEPPPPEMEGFDSAFVEVTVATESGSRTLIGLLDTGATITVLRRGLLDEPAILPFGRQPVTIEHDQLGAVSLSVGLFDTPGLPDVILGNDIMSAWGDRWYFDFTPGGGGVTVFTGPGAEVLNLKSSSGLSDQRK